MLDVAALSVTYGEHTVVDNASVTISDGELVAILGPSGAGKSSLLRAVAGLVSPAAGTIFWDGADVTSMPPHQRNFGLMFQDYALFPHRSVAGNVGYGLAVRGDDPDSQTKRVAEVLGWVGLEGYERRSVNTLSGGEQQRVALARALAPSPHLLMLDEPVGSLDRALRQRLTSELRDVLTEHAVTTLYVTHDQEEALELADRIVVMKNGRIRQIGTPRQLWDGPADRWVAEFLNVGTVIEHSGTSLLVRRDAATLGGETPATVTRSVFQGTYCSVELTLTDGSRFSANLPPDEYTPGQSLTISLDPSKLIELGS